LIIAKDEITVLYSNLLSENEFMEWRKPKEALQNITQWIEK